MLPLCCIVRDATPIQSDRAPATVPRGGDSAASAVNDFVNVQHHVAFLSAHRAKADIPESGAKCQPIADIRSTVVPPPGCSLRTYELPIIGYCSFHERGSLLSTADNPTSRH